MIKGDILTRVNECYVVQIEGQPNPTIDEPEMRAHRVVGDGNDIYPDRPKSELAESCNHSEWRFSISSRLGQNVVHNAATIISLDRVLANYGPETQEIRASIKRSYAGSIQMLDSGDVKQLARLGNPEAVSQTENFQRKIEEITPHNAAQGRLQAHALQIVDEVFAQRWLALLQAQGSIPMSLLVIFVAWLSVIFGTFGLFAPRNGTIIAAFVVCALSTAGAIF